MPPEYTKALGTNMFRHLNILCRFLDGVFVLFDKLSFESGRFFVGVYKAKFGFGNNTRIAAYNNPSAKSSTC